MVTLEFPVFVSVSLKERLPPTFAFPKLRLVGFAPSRKVAAAPVPLSAIVRGEPGALLVMEAVPLALPVAEGANCAVKVGLWSGGDSGEIEEAAVSLNIPEALAAEIVTLAVPELVNVTVCDAVL